MDAELEFAIQPNTTGKQLFDQVSFNPTKHVTVCMSVCGLCVCVFGGVHMLRPEKIKFSILLRQHLSLNLESG